MHCSVHWLCCGAIVMACMPSVALAQSSVNPDMSILPRFVLKTNDGERLAEGIREFSRPDFAFEELELAAQAYLNPFAKADVVFAIAGRTSREVPSDSRKCMPRFCGACRSI